MGLESAPAILDRVTAFLESHDGQRVSIVVFSLAATVLIAAFPGGALAYILGIPLIFFVPGFALVRLAFWKNTSPEAKFVLSLGLSVLVVIFLGLILVFTVGLGTNSTKASLVMFAVGAVALERFWKPADKGEPKLTEKIVKEETKPEKMDMVVAAMLGTALVISAISLGLIVTAEYPETTYFAMTDENGSLEINTTRVLHTDITLQLTVFNGERGERDFSIAAHDRNFTIYPTQWFNNPLEKGDKWVQNITFSLDTPGTVRLDFDLYIQETGKPPVLYGNLHLWLYVQ